MQEETGNKKEENTDSPQPTQIAMEEVLTQESGNEEGKLDSPSPIQIAKEREEEEGNKEKGTDSPRPTQITMEQNESVQQEEETLAGNEEKDVGLSQSTPTEQIILVDAFTQTEFPSVSDVCTETDSFQALK